MPSLELLLEAERRGILPENKKALLAEARNRGLVPKLDNIDNSITFPNKILQSLTLPEKKSREGLNLISSRVPYFEPTGNTARDIALNTPKIMAETLAETAPQFLSRGSLLTAGALRGAKFAAPAIRAAGRGLAKGAESISGLEYKTPNVLQEVFKEPSILWGKGKKTIGELFASKADPKALEQGVLDIKNISDKKEVVKQAMEAANQNLLNSDEALIARQELWSLKKAFPKEYFRNAYKTLGEIAKIKYGDLDPKFARAVRSEAVRTIFPTNKGGGSSIAKMFVGSFAPPLGLAMSPFIQGTVAAGAGGVSKLAKPFINKPLLGTALVPFIKRKNEE